MTITRYNLTHLHVREIEQFARDVRDPELDDAIAAYWAPALHPTTSPSFRMPTIEQLDMIARAVEASREAADDRAILDAG